MRRVLVLAAALGRLVPGVALLVVEVRGLLVLQGEDVNQQRDGDRPERSGEGAEEHGLARPHPAGEWDDGEQPDHADRGRYRGDAERAHMLGCETAEKIGCPEQQRAAKTDNDSEHDNQSEDFSNATDLRAGPPGWRTHPGGPPWQGASRVARW